MKITKNINGRRRFSLFGINGFYAKRSKKSRGWGIEQQNTFTQLHLGKRSIGFEVRPRHTWNFAG